MSLNPTRQIRSFAGVVRTGFWAIATLWLIGALFPLPDSPVDWNNISAPAKVFTMARAMDDPRGFRRLDSQDDGSKWQIAWISGSGTQVIWPKDTPNPTVNEFMPMHVRPKVEAALGQETEILLYVMQAGTPIDKSFALQDALRRNVDLIIYEVNPAYDYGYYVSSMRQNLVSSVARPALSNMSLAATVLGHAQLQDTVASLVQYRLPAIGDRWAYRAKLAKATLPVPAPSTAVQARDPNSPAVKIATATSWSFWSSYRPRTNEPAGGFRQACHLPNHSGETNWCDHILSSISVQRPDLEAGSASITDDNIRVLASSGKLAIIYLSPIAPIARAEPPILANHQLMQERLDRLGKGFDPSYTCVKPGFSPQFLSHQQFRDAVHLKSSEPMASEMSRTIVDFVKQGKCG